MRMRIWARAAVGLASAALLLAATTVPAGAAGGDSTPPTTPGNLRVTAVTATSISLAWDPSSDSGGLTRYIVFQSYDDTANGHVEYGTFVSPSSTTRTDEIGVRGFTKTYWVVAEDLAGNRSADSNRVTGTTTPDTTPPTTPRLAVTGTTQSTASLSWTESTDDAGYLSYRIFVDGVLWAFLAPIPSTNRQTTTIVRHLRPGAAHAITVRAADSAGNLSAPSNTVTATTQPSTDTTPPTTPALRITRDQGCAVTLAWTASSDNVEPASAIEYEILVNGIIQRLVVGATSTTAYHTNVDGSNTFAVRALDRSGNISPLSNPVTSVFQEC